MRNVLPFIFTLLSTFAHAQHCGYDFASVIVLRPHTEEDTALIQGLHITLLDSANLPLTNQGSSGGNFLSNSAYEACADRQGAFMEGRHVCFPFAKDNYTLVISAGYDTSKMKVLVRDERPRSPTEIRRRKWPKRYGGRWCRSQRSIPTACAARTIQRCTHPWRDARTSHRLILP